MPPLPLSSPPESLCLLRLSAIGDISHTLPTLRTLQAAWPATRITWIIGRVEHALVGDIPGVDFIIFDKGRRSAAYGDLRRALRGRRFDVLLHMQTALRASLAALLVPARIKLGFDRRRARDLQWLFTNARIAPRERQHVLESFLGFADALGVHEHRLRWDIPIPEAAHEAARRHIPDGQPTLLISPCASHAYRDWHPAGYAAVADHARERWGMQTILTGGQRPEEARMAQAIAQHARHAPLDLVGRSNLKELLALLERANVLLAPDSGPAHLATAVGTPVVGLYAATNPERAGPYLSRDLVVDRYREAVRAQYGKMPTQLPWGIRVRTPGTMDRITVEDVTRKLDQAAARAGLH